MYINCTLMLKWAHIQSSIIQSHHKYPTNNLGNNLSPTCCIVNTVFDLHCALRVFKIAGKTSGKICFCQLRVHFKKKNRKGLIWWCLCDFFWFFLQTHMLWVIIWLSSTSRCNLNVGTHNLYLYKEVDKKYTGCNLKTIDLLDCELIGICAIIR